MRNHLAMVAFVFLITSRTVTAQSTSEQEINLNQRLFLTVKQQRTLPVEAMRGSGEAATKLFLFHGFVALNPTEEHRWIVIGAENGDISDQFNLYQDLIGSGDELDKQRAEFWLRKAADAGDRYAQDELKVLVDENRANAKTNTRGVSRTVMAQKASGQAINLNDDLVLDSQERQSLSVEAMRGSADAATRISVFYGFVLLNPIEERRWALIAAENGDPAAQWNVYQDFINNDTALDRERAFFWLRRSAAGGYKMAQDELKDIKQKKKYSARKTAEVKAH